MTPISTRANQSTDRRDVRALTQYLTVLPVAPDVYEVVSQSGRSYTVDARYGVCTCDDYRYRRPADGCKHVRRVGFATGERPVPEDVAAEAIDDQLGRHVEGGPTVLVADGGEAVEANDRAATGQADDVDGSSQADDVDGTSQTDDVDGSSQADDVDGTSQTDDVDGTGQADDVDGTGQADEKVVVLGPLPAITTHVEPPEQGAARYWRCAGCGRETIYGREAIVHAEGCPRRDVETDGT